MTVKPWTPEQRARIKSKIDKEAARAAARLGAKTVTIIAFFDDGDYMHMADGGTAPMSSHELYQHMVSIGEVLKESGGEDVSVQ